ncbi:MAG TPA: SDR family NAD(P)-dependent oxidoreductase [Longimicrobiales bacterium]|nr:SDR family NAD(P)-dependent oxidoreductase [Longimicrobiales bacterium]
MRGELAGRTAVVTGAAHGLGREIASTLARAGAAVHAWDVLAEELEETARLAAGSLRTRVVDVTDTDGVAVAVEDVLAGDAGLHILVNCAGGVLHQVGRPVEDVSREDFDAIVAVNLTGVFNTVRAAARAMKAAGYGRVVNISSGAGLGVSKTGIQAYAAAKAGQIGLTRQLAHELGPFGITVNCVAPGFVRSNPATERQWDAYGPEGQRALLEGIAMRRLGAPADIAEAVLFLASDRADWITGQCLPVDGGK